MHTVVGSKLTASSLSLTGGYNKYRIGFYHEIDVWREGLEWPLKENQRVKVFGRSI
jgi:hypothetical protein